MDEVMLVFSEECYKSTTVTSCELSKGKILQFIYIIYIDGAILH